MKQYLNPNTNELFAYELDGSQDHLIPDHYVKVTDEEAESVRKAILSELISQLDYDERRRSEYPSIGDQLDMLWHGMNSGELPKVDSFYKAIKSVKDKNPKG